MRINLDLAPLKRKWQEDPITTLAVSAAAVASAAKLLDAVSAAQGRRAYAKQVNSSVKRKNRK